MKVLNSVRQVRTYLQKLREPDVLYIHGWRLTLAVVEPGIWIERAGEVVHFEPDPKSVKELEEHVATVTAHHESC